MPLLTEILPWEAATPASSVLHEGAALGGPVPAVEADNSKSSLHHLHVFLLPIWLAGDEPLHSRICAQHIPLSICHFLDADFSSQWPQRPVAWAAQLSLHLLICSMMGLWSPLSIFLPLTIQREVFILTGREECSSREMKLFWRTQHLLTSPLPPPPPKTNQNRINLVWIGLHVQSH